MTICNLTVWTPKTPELGMAKNNGKLGFCKSLRKGPLCYKNSVTTPNLRTYGMAVIIIHSPAIHNIFQFGQIQEQFAIEQLVPHTGIE